MIDRQFFGRGGEVGEFLFRSVLTTFRCLTTSLINDKHKSFKQRIVINKVNFKIAKHTDISIKLWKGKTTF